jgi:uncharacterized membrane protein YdcZ (DUF606 family)
MYLLLAFFIGVSIVLNMIMNGKIAQKEGMINGILINYLVAAFTSIILCVMMINGKPDYEALKSIPLIYFLGGYIGVITTYLFNLIVPRVPAVYIVVLRFIGQLLTSALIDYLYLHVFSIGKIIGGCLFFIGLILNARADEKYEKEKIRLLGETR